MPAPMFIVCGAPGAGKSTFANHLRGTENAFIFETDNFFVDSIDKRAYHFDFKQLGLAHTWNQGEVFRACRDCPDVPVIVANTFINTNELYPYLEIARAFGRKAFIFRLLTEHDNVHGVGPATVADKRVRARATTAEQVLTRCKSLGYPVVYCVDIRNDEDARSIAQITHAKYFQRA